MVSNPDQARLVQDQEHYPKCKDDEGNPNSSRLTVGVIIVAVIGNAGIAIGSSTQVALFVAPLLVFLSYVIAAGPMDLAFTMGEIFAILIADDNGGRDKRRTIQLVHRRFAFDPLPNPGRRLLPRAIFIGHTASQLEEGGLGMDGYNDPADTIELRVKAVGQLFHSYEPFPFLNKEIEDYIVSWVRMHAKNQPIKIIIQLPEKEFQTTSANKLAEAFACYFGYHADLLQHDLDELYRDGRRFLAIGMTILVSCLVVSQIAGRYLTEGPFRRLLEQGLPILGWVANWRPLEILLYDWWPLARRRDLYRRLATASVETKISTS